MCLIASYYWWWFENGKGILSTRLFAYCFFTSAILLYIKRK
jgi:hypothetical protein